MSAARSASAAAEDRRPELPVLVSVCTTCRVEELTGPGPALLAALREAAGGREDVAVRPVQCLGVCKRPATVAVSAQGGYTFLFGGLDDEAAAALLGFAASYARTDYGYVPWRERAEVLRRGLVARLPPAAWSPEDGRNPP